MNRFLKNSIASGLTVVLGIMMCVIASSIFGLSAGEYSTLSVCVLAGVSMMLLFRISMPFNLIRVILFILMNTGMICGVLCFTDFLGFNVFSLVGFDIRLALILAGIIVISLLVYIAVSIPVQHYSHKLEKLFIEFRKKRSMKKK